MKNFILFISFSLLISLNGLGQTLHLIIAADVEDIEFGFVSISDEAIIQNMFTSVAKAIEYKMETIYLEKSRFTASSIEETIQNVQTKSKDLLIFYYSGKTYYSTLSDQDNTYLKVKNWQYEPISLATIMERVRMKRETFGFVFAECRDTFLPTQPGSVSDDGVSSIPDDAFSLKPVESGFEKIIARKMFLQNCSDVMVTSHENGRNSFADPKNNVSEFTKRFVHNYYGLISLIDLRDIDSFNLNHLLNITLSNQKSVHKIFPCDSLEENLVEELPKYKNYLSLSTLSNNIFDLLIEESDSLRTKAVNGIKLGFTKESKVQIIKFKAGKNRVQTKTQKASTYWNNKINRNPKLMDIQILSDKIERTEDLSKISGITIQEMWE